MISPSIVYRLDAFVESPSVLNCKLNFCMKIFAYFNNSESTLSNAVKIKCNPEQIKYEVTIITVV